MKYSNLHIFCRIAKTILAYGLVMSISCYPYICVEVLELSLQSDHAVFSSFLIKWLYTTLIQFLQVSVLVLAHTRELAFQISKEYERFSKYMNNVKIAVFFGGMSIKKDEECLSKNCPHIIVGTPGRILALIHQKSLSLKHVKHFILDECDKMLSALGMGDIMSIM